MIKFLYFSLFFLALLQHVKCLTSCTHEESTGIKTITTTLHLTDFSFPRHSGDMDPIPWLQGYSKTLLILKTVTDESSIDPAKIIVESYPVIQPVKGRRTVFPETYLYIRSIYKNRSLDFLDWYVVILEFRNSDGTWSVKYLYFNYLFHKLEIVEPGNNVKYTCSLED